MKTNNVNPIFWASDIDAAIGRAFIDAESQFSIDHLRSIFNRVAGLVHRIRIIGELQIVEYIKFNKHTREKPDPFDDSATVGIEVLMARIATAIEDLRELKFQAIDAMDFERAANYRDI
ncbi:MAG: UvrB/UvrC motif-containing protein [Breznakibacter sp.]